MSITLITLLITAGIVSPVIVKNNVRQRVYQRFGISGKILTAVANTCVVLLIIPIVLLTFPLREMTGSVLPFELLNGVVAGVIVAFLCSDIFFG